MKKTVKTITVAMAAIIITFISLECAARDNAANSKIKVTDIRNDKGQILIAAGDYSKPTEMAVAMVPATGGSMECALSKAIEPGTEIYVIHDENGNFNLDMTADGKPTEGCFKGIAKTDGNGMVVVALEYYSASGSEIS